MKKSERLIYAIISIIIFLLLWQFLTTYTKVGLTTPKPINVLNYLFFTLTNKLGKYTIIGHSLLSIKRVLFGFFLGTLAGVVLGIAMGVNKIIRAVFKPFFEVFRQIPPIAWIPMAILWFGLGETPKIFIIFIGTFVNVLINSYYGTVNVDNTLIGAAKMLGASEFQIFYKVILPQSIPQIFNGMQVGFSVSWMGVLAAELVSSYAGIGWVIIRGSDTANIEQVMVGMIVIGFIGLILSSIMRYIERKLTRWNFTEI